jgi:pyruvate ferredoxin oxidoreductase gamma subunit
MIAVVGHGRGGPGVVTTAEILAMAAFRDGRHAQAVPSFGSERTGAPVLATCRMHDRPIRGHEPVQAPDIVVVQDPTLLHQVAVFAGLRPHGLALVNSARGRDALGLDPLAQRARVRTVAATDIARRIIGRPLPGAPLLGALAATEGLISIDGLDAALRERFPGPLGAANAAAARAAYEDLHRSAHAPAA